MKRNIIILIVIFIISVLIVPATDDNLLFGSELTEDELLKEYELTFKDKEGDIDFYAMRSVYYHGNSIGITQNREEFLCSFQREVLKVTDDSLMVRYTWKKFKAGMGKGENKEVTEWKTYSFSDGISYEIDLNCPNYLDAVDYEPIPKTMLGMKFVVNIMDAHAQFDLLRNENNGNISKLKKVGDRITANDAHKSSSWDFPPLVTESDFTNGDYETLFTGIGIADGKKCAVLEYINSESKLKNKIQISPNMTMKMEGITNFWGHIYVDLESSKLIRGDLYEYVVVTGTSSLTGTIRLSERRLVEINKITREEFQKNGDF